MRYQHFPPADRNGIIRILPDDLSEVNRRRIGKFSAFMFLYDVIQDRWIRPRIHKADPEKHRSMMRAMIGHIRNAEVLDIGCGAGAALHYFDLSNAYTGLDLSYALLKQAVKKAKYRFFRQVQFIQGNAESLQFEDESFDTVLIDTSLHMIPEYEKCIAETARVLKTGSLCVLSCPTMGINPDFDTSWVKIAPGRHLHSFRESDFQVLFAEYGLRYERVGTNGSMLYFRGIKA